MNQNYFYNSKFSIPCVKDKIEFKDVLNILPSVLSWKMEPGLALWIVQTVNNDFKLLDENVVEFRKTLQLEILKAGQRLFPAEFENMEE